MVSLLCVCVAALKIVRRQLIVKTWVGVVKFVGLGLMRDKADDDEMKKTKNEA